MDGPMRLTGHGLVLREWEDADLPALPGLFDEDLVAENTPVPSPFVAEEYLAMMRRTRAEDGRLHLAVTTGGGAPLGLGFFHPGRGEIGYIVGREHRRQGLALRTTLLLTEFGHDRHGLPRLRLRILETNTGSIAVARAAGYRHAGSERLAGDGRLLEVWLHESP